MNQLKSIILFLSILAVFPVYAQDIPWDVPQDQQANVAPFLFNADAQKAGEDIYLRNCKSCHGDIGKHNMIALNPLPKDFTAANVSSESDGSLYYKIANGRGPMPSFKNVLTPSNIWQVIAYIRSFHPNYVQPEIVQVKVFEGDAVLLAMKWLANEKQIKIKAFTKDKVDEIPAQGVEVALFAQRYFGLLKIGESTSTNELGEAIFTVDNEIPGDTAGYIKFVAKATDMEKYGDVNTTDKFIAGIINNKPGLTEERAIWNVVSKAPWWITIAYPAAVLGVVTVLLYILMVLKRIYKLGA